MENYLCFYHSADLDGKMSAAIVKKKYPNCELYPINYGEQIPWDLIHENLNIIIVDFCFQPHELMIKIKEKCKNMIWIDHHRSAINSLTDEQFDGIRDITYAGCELAWKYFFDDNIPLPIKLLGRYDVWDHSNESFWENEILPFQYGIRLHCNTPEDLLKYLDLYNKCGSQLINDVIREGQICLKYQNLQNKEYAKRYAYFVNWQGYCCCCINIGMSNSTIFDSITDLYDIMVVYCNTNSKSYTISLYSKSSSGIDVSSIASKYGGGGHANAAGFQTNKLPWMR